MFDCYFSNCTHETIPLKLLRTSFLSTFFCSEHPQSQTANFEKPSPYNVTVKVPTQKLVQTALCSDRSLISLPRPDNFDSLIENPLAITCHEDNPIPLLIEHLRAHTFSYMYRRKPITYIDSLRICFSNYVANSPSGNPEKIPKQNFSRSPFLDYSFQTVPSVATYKECPFPDVSFDT